MAVRVIGHPSICRRRAQQCQLLRHRPQFARGHKRLFDARRTCRPRRMPRSSRVSRPRAALLCRRGRLGAFFVGGCGSAAGWLCRVRRVLRPHRGYCHQNGQHARNPAWGTLGEIWGFRDPHVSTLCRFCVPYHAKSETGPRLHQSENTNPLFRHTGQRLNLLEMNPSSFPRGTPPCRVRRAAAVLSSPLASACC